MKKYTLEEIKAMLSKDNIYETPIGKYACEHASNYDYDSDTLDCEEAVRDEYGTIFTSEQFWNEEVGKSLYNDPDKYINCEQYYKDKPRNFDIREFTSSDGLRFSMSEFC